jgi:folate-dependent phosphoribosylglycinamide formyltransferase PurN
VPVQPGDDEDALRSRIQAAEKPLYVVTLKQLCQEMHTG